MSAIKKQEQRTAYLFITPFIAGFMLFHFFPPMYAFILSFMDYNKFKPLSETTFTGLTNYAKIFQDPLALQAYAKAFYYTLLFVPGRIVFSFIMALLLNRVFFCRILSRTMIFVPYVSNIVAIAVVFGILLDPSGGPINQLLTWLGDSHPPKWLGGIHTVLPTIAGISVWHGSTFDMIIYLAALQGVPKDLYESAGLDGASRWAKIRYITLPLVSPATFFILVTSIIHSLQNYSIIRVMSNGGPGTASRVISLNIYSEAFTYSHYSYATAQAIILFLFILFVTMLQWKGQKKWVHY